MHLNDCVILAVGLAAAAGGVIMGARADARASSLLRKLVLVVVGVFTLNIVVGPLVAKWHVAREGGVEWLQLGIFWVFVMGSGSSLFCFIYGSVLTLRRGHRKDGVGLCLISLSPVVIFLLAGVLKRFIPPFG